MERLIGFSIVLCRVCAFFLAAPIFGFAAIPVMVRACCAVVLSVFFASCIQVPAGIGSVGALQLILILVAEATYGLLLGLVVQMVLAAIRCGGEIIEQQMGLTTAEMVDPLTGQEEQPVAVLLEMIFLLLLLASDGHHLLLGALLRSLDGFPIGHVPTIQMMTYAIVKAGSALLLIGLRLAAPILVAFLLLYVVLAVFARVVPEMDILLLTFPARIGLGLIMTWVLIPVMQELVGQVGRWMTELLPL